MRLKKGVVIIGLKLPMREVILQANQLWKNEGQELVITSGLEGTHSAGSLHPFGYALDLRTRYFTHDQVHKVTDLLRAALGPEYDVVLEPDHIHTEYDPFKNRTVYSKWDVNEL